ncbi:hypothetical protein [Mucilaginibacter sp.]|uniref:hypothetical protein n=1 Tax=Mucilaginibacter sp. TaxID=1882438 RepID=UPI00326391C5
MIGFVIVTILFGTILAVFAKVEDGLTSQKLKSKFRGFNEKYTFKQIFFRANLCLVGLILLLQVGQAIYSQYLDNQKEKNARKQDNAKALKDSLRQDTIIKKFGESLKKADTTISRLQPILLANQMQLSLQKENVDSAKRILEKNDSLLTKQNDTYKGMKLLLNPLSPLNMILQFRVSFKTGYTDSLEASIYALRDRAFYSKYINFSQTKDTVVIPNMDSLKSLNINVRAEYDNFIKTVIIVTKQPVHMYKSGFPNSGMKGSVFVTGLIPELEEYLALRTEFIPFRRVIKTLVVDFKKQEFIFEAKFYDLKGNEASGNFMSNDISFDNLSGCNFLIATNSDYRERIIRLERITVSSTYGTRKGFFMDFKKAPILNMDGKAFYYHKINNKDFRPPDVELDLGDF